MKKFYYLPILLAALTLSACGSDDDDGGGSALSSVTPSAAPSPTMRDLNGNVYRLYSVGNLQFTYDENGKLTGAYNGEDWMYIQGNKFVFTYEDGEYSGNSTYTMNISLNANGHISQMAWEENSSYSDGDTEKSAGSITYSYNSSKQCTGYSGQGWAEWNEPEYNESRKESGTIKSTITWTGGNLVKAVEESKTQVSGTEEGHRYSYNASNKHTYDLTYGTTSNPLKQMPIAVAQACDVYEEYGLFGVLGFHGVGPANLPTSYKWTEVETEDGEAYTHNGEEALSYTLNYNGTIAQEKMGYYTFNYGYSPVGGNRVRTKAAKQTVEQLKKRFFPRHHKRHAATNGK